mgnify:CR=1 FL=1
MQGRTIDQKRAEADIHTIPIGRRKEIIMKRSVVVLLTICLLLSTSMMANAYELPETTKREELQAICAAVGDYEGARIEIHDAHKPQEPTRYICINCNWFCVTVCAAEAVHYDTGRHGDCEVYYFKSRGAMMCPTCQTAWVQYGYHDCWEVHKTCWKGYYDVCPMEVT